MISLAVARSSTTSDVFNAIGDAHRREILDLLIAGEKPVGAIVDDLTLSQPQVSKHLRVLSEVGLVRCRADGRRRLYSLEPAHLRPMQEWLAKYEQAWSDRLDRIDDYLKGLQRRPVAASGVSAFARQGLCGRRARSRLGTALRFERSGSHRRSRARLSRPAIR
jgi:DNA-binding transcriptional ArsR family regulator